MTSGSPEGHATDITDIQGASEWPISFSDAMVRALLGGYKTQTRRLVTDRNSTGNYPASQLDLAKAWVDPGPSPAGNPGPYLQAPVLGDNPGDVVERLFPRWSVGDRLWVRERWRGWNATGFQHNDKHLIELDYFADRSRCGIIGSHEQRVQAMVVGGIDVGETRDPWRRAEQMPRWAARLQLEVVAVRAERVQRISDADCFAEGIQSLVDEGQRDDGTARGAFQVLWDSVVTREEDDWRSNPWVWVIEFACERLR